MPPPSFGGPAVFFTDAERMELFDIPKGKYNQLLVRVTPYSDALARKVASEIKERLSKEDIGVAVTIYQDPEKHWGHSIMAGINLVLQIMAVTAPGASVVLVLNTVMALVTQQTDQIGIIKAIGGTQGTIIKVYLVGVPVYGLLALLISLPLGAFLAYNISPALFHVSRITSHVLPENESLLVSSPNSIIPPTMTQERLYRTDAIILRRTDFGEADRLLTVFTPERGKLRLLAKGVRKTTSRKAGHVELFMLTDMLIAHGRTWDIVSQAEIVEPYRALREDLDKTSHAYYLAELVDRFTEEHDANAPLFELLAITLARLSHLDDPFVALRYFELHLLSLTGFQPQLHFCLACSEALEPVENYFHFADGGMLCPEHGPARPNAEPVSLPVLKVLRFLQTEPWETVANLQLTPTTRQQVENLLLGYITFLLERQLKSVDFIKKLRQRA